MITRSCELKGLLDRARDQVLNILFSGGVIRGKKLQRGSIYRFDDILDKKAELEFIRDNPGVPSKQEIGDAHKSVSLLN